MSGTSISTHILRTALVFAAISPLASGQTWDLSTDWSDTSNPNGSWSFNEGINVLPPTNDVGLPWLQPGWAPGAPPSEYLPYWVKAVDTDDAFDFVVGDVLMHSQDHVNGEGQGQGNVTWTSPFNGSIDISGHIWPVRDIGRANDWTLYFNETPLTAGAIGSGDPYSRSTPFYFAAGSGGPGVLEGIPVSVGDVVKLEIVKTSTYGDIAGVSMSITGSLSVPTMSSWGLLVCMLALISIGILVFRPRATEAEEAAG